VLLLRGEPVAAPEGNLLLDHLFGAEIHWCTPEDYRWRRQALLEELAERLRRQGRVPYVIPEGGSNALGARGYAAAAAELLGQAGVFDAVFVAVGSGGTLAGLALGPEIGPLRGVAVAEDAATFHQRVLAIAAEAGQVLPEPGPRWQVLEGYQGEGYGLCSPEVWRTIRRVAQAEGVLLDPVYTGKAMHALFEEVRAGRCGGRVLFWHTGGAFGVFGRSGEGVGD
jgi:D-cysteine desulfhydrase